VVVRNYEVFQDLRAGNTVLIKIIIHILYITTKVRSCGYIMHARPLACEPQSL
jgi:hypothetical protein